MALPRGARSPAQTADARPSPVRASSPHPAWPGQAPWTHFRSGTELEGGAWDAANMQKVVSTHRGAPQRCVLGVQAPPCSPRSVQPHPGMAGKPAARAWAPTRLPFPSVAGQRGRAGCGSLRGQQTPGGLSSRGRPPGPSLGHSSCTCISLGLLDPPLPAGRPQRGTRGLHDGPPHSWGKQPLSGLDAEHSTGAGLPRVAGARARGHPPASQGGDATARPAWHHHLFIP